jgi:hypothetical protein
MTKRPLRSEFLPLDPGALCLAGQVLAEALTGPAAHARATRIKRRQTPAVHKQQDPRSLGGLDFQRILSSGGGIRTRDLRIMTEGSDALQSAQT